jgi:hypothetical protein
MLAGIVKARETTPSFACLRRVFREGAGMGASRERRPGNVPARAPDRIPPTTTLEVRDLFSEKPDARRFASGFSTGSRAGVPR